MFDYIDIHSHLYFPDFDADREAEIEKLKEKNIATISIGTDLQSCQKSIALAEKHENIFASVGFHPGDVTKETVFDERLESLVSNKKVVAIGECGLDYYRMDSSDVELKNNQKKIFQNQIDLALKYNLPLMLHIRPQKGTHDAYEDALEILEKQKLRGNVHFFVGNVDIMKRFVTIGFSTSFTGVITFTRDYDEVVKEVPLDMIMSETDAPFVAPVPYRGKRNSPLYIEEIVKKISEIKNESLDKVKNQLVKNAMQMFHLHII